MSDVRRGRVNDCVRIALLGVLLLAIPVSARAQAWLPAKGEGYVSTIYTNVFVDKHYLLTTRYDLGRIDSNTFLFDATYGVTDRLAVSVTLPLVLSRYTGNRPHPGTQTTVMDDGTWHSTFQDFRFSVRYNVIRGRVTITPFVGGGLPSHDYEYWAHSAAGRRLREVQAGVSAARLLDEITPGLFVQGRYSFAFPQRVLDVRPQRSNSDLELGYFISTSLRVFALAAAQLTHDGIDIPPNAPEVLTAPQRQHHDQIGRENFLTLGVGAAIDVSESIALFGAFLKQAAGRNSHELDRAISLGITWSFRRTQQDSLFSRAYSRQRPLIRCVCQKAIGK